MNTLSAFIIGLCAGYVTAIYTWSKVRPFLKGFEVELDDLRARTREIEKQLRGK